MSAALLRRPLVPILGFALAALFTPPAHAADAHFVPMPADAGLPFASPAAPPHPSHGVTQRPFGDLTRPPALPTRIPDYSPNARANDPAGDGTNETQTAPYTALWGRFAVTVWVDSKSQDPPAATPPNTRGGYATSCDWGQTWADAGSLPRPSTSQQVFTPHLTSDGRGNFYLAAVCATSLNSAGATLTSALAFWKGSFDTTTCSFTWGPQQLIGPIAGTSPAYTQASVAVDPNDNSVYVGSIVSTSPSQTARIFHSTDGGATWSAATDVSAGSALPYRVDLAVGPNHELGITWGDESHWYWCDFSTNAQGSVWFAKSTDHGASFSAPVAVAPLRSYYWSEGPMDPLGFYMRAYPRIAADRSSGPGRGNFYLAWPGSASRSAQAATGVTVTESEPDDTPDHAVVFAAGDSVLGSSASVADEDWYKVHLLAGQSIAVRAEGQGFTCGGTSSYGFYVQLYAQFLNPAAPSYDSLLTSSFNSGLLSEISFTCHADGDYYVWVAPANAITGPVTYTLETRRVTNTQLGGTGRDESDILLSRSTDGGSSWTTPIVVNQDAPVGYYESWPGIDVDARGVVRVAWHDHRESEGPTRTSLRGQRTDLYLAESQDGGLTFQPGLRVSDGSSQFDSNQRVAYVRSGNHADLSSDGQHLMTDWDDERPATAATQSIDVMTQFVDREPPRVALLGAPADSTLASSLPLSYTLSADDRRNRHAGNTYQYSLFDAHHGGVLAQGAFPTDSTLAVTAALVGAAGDGAYRLDLSASDARGNASPAIRRWFLLDRTAPFVAFLSSPNGLYWNNPTASMTWSGADPTPGWDGVPGTLPVQYGSRLDGGAWSAYGSPPAASSLQFSSLAEGRHTVNVRVRDAAGNVSADACTFDRSSLAGWWPGEGSAADLQGGHDGAAAGGVTYPDGRNGHAFSFDGSGGIVRVPNSADLNPGSGSMTVEAWVRTSNAPADQTIVSMYECAGSCPAGLANSIYQLKVLGGQAFFYFRDADAGGPASMDSGQQLLAGPPLADGQWHHVAGVRDQSTHELRLYVDGQVVASAPLNPGADGAFGNLDGETDPFTIGATITGGTNQAGLPFAGQIDDVLYWNRPLSDAELADAVGRVGRAPCGTISATWTFDQTPPTTAILSPAEGAQLPAGASALSWMGHDNLTSQAGLTYDVQVDGGAWQPAASSTSQQLDLAGGPHTVSVRTHDAAGASDVAPPVVHFSVQLTPPSIAFTGPAPGAWTPANTQIAWTLATRSAAANPDSILYAWSLDQGAFTTPARDSVAALSGLAEGPHQLVVRVSDNLAQSSQSSLGFTVDVTPPLALVVSGPAEGASVAQAAATFTVGGSDNLAPAPSLLYSTRVDGAAYGAFSSATNVDLRTLGLGAHTLDVRAQDPAGNVSASPATRHFAIGGFIVDAASQVIETSRLKLMFAPDCPERVMGAWYKPFSATAQVNGEGLPWEFSGQMINGLWLGQGPIFSQSTDANDHSWNVISQNASQLVLRIESHATYPGQLNPRVRTDYTFYADSSSYMVERTVFFSGQNWGVSSLQPYVFRTSLAYVGTLRWRDANGVLQSGGFCPSGCATNLWDGRWSYMNGATLSVAVMNHPTNPPAMSLMDDYDGNSSAAWTGPITASQAWTTDQTWRLLVHFSTTPGNFGLEDNVYSWWSQLPVPGTAPKPVLTAGPAVGGFSGASPVFAWTLGVHSAPASSTTYATRLDGGPTSAFASDTSLALSGLPVGAHALWVIARDNVNRRDSTLVNWTVDVVAPAVLIGSGPLSGWTAGVSVTIGFTGADDVEPASALAYAWSLDGGAYGGYAAAASAGLTGLAEGSHTFQVRARDAAGNVGAPASLSFIVDRTPPETVILSGPAPGATVDSLAATLTWSGGDDRTGAGALRFATRTDGAAFSPPAGSTAATLTGLPDGAHTFEVAAVDLAGNQDPTPASRAFLLDALGPVITINSGPVEGACVNSPGVSFAWSATDAVTPAGQIITAWQIDGGGYGAFGGTTSATIGPLPDGAHTFSVRARDGAGHLTTLARPFQVDLTAPAVNAPTTRLLDANRVRIQCTASDNSAIAGYRMQVAGATDFATLLADVSLGTNGAYDFTGSPGGTYFARAQAIDCAGNTSGFSAASNVASLANLPDLVVNSVSAPPSMTAGAATAVSYAVANTGLGASSAPQWTDLIYFSPTPAYDPATAVLAGQHENVTYLAPGESYSATQSLTPPLGTSGTRYVLIVADGKDQLAESSGANNGLASAPVSISLGQYADLQVSQVVAPPTALSSEVVTVNWTVRNAGSGRTNSADWWDTVFLTPAPALDYTVYDATRLLVHSTPHAQVHHFGALDPAGSYTASAQVTLPGNASGALYAVVASDLYADAANQVVSERGSVFENLDELNVRAADSTSVTAQAPPDLAVTSVTGPAAGLAGGTVPVSWTVRNGGFNPTPPAGWSDIVRLSADGVLDAGDPTLLVVRHSGGLALGSTYTASSQVRVPPSLQGAFHVFVTSDGYGEVYEYREDNNSAEAAALVSVTLPPSSPLVAWPNLAPQSGSVAGSGVAGGFAAASWTVVNAGSAAAGGDWDDLLEIGANPVWQPGLPVVGSVHLSRTLPAGGSYAAEAQARIPTSASGTWYLFVHTDAYNSQFENTDEGDNARLLGAVQVAPYPPVDLSVSGVTAPASATGGQPLNVGYTVTNAGAAATLSAGWSEDVWLSADPVYSPATDLLLSAPGHGGVLGAGASYSRTVGGTLPHGFGGTVYAIVRSDPGGSTGDVTPGNNLAVSAPIVVTPDQPADLTVHGLTVTAASISGQPLAVNWTVHNAGPAAVSGRAWFTSVYLSQDPVLDGTDIPLGSVQGAANLVAGGDDAEALTVTVPSWAVGAYYVIVAADTRNDLWEGASEGNNTSFGTTLATLPPASDLVVGNVSIPASASPGDPVSVSYTLSNTGANPAVGQLQNAAYASLDAVFDAATDPLVGIEVQNVNIPPGAIQPVRQQFSLFRPLQVDAAGNVTGTLPPLAPGAYHVIVRANVRNSVRELDLSNNLAVSTAALQSQLPALTLGVPVGLVTAAQQQRYFQVTPGADLDLYLSLSSNVADATNDLYVAYGRVPTESDYDNASGGSFTANPSVLVPQTQAGVYYVLVVSRSLGPIAPSESLTLTGTALSFSIAGVTPATGGSGGVVTCRVTGAGFRDTTLFRLEQSGITRATSRLTRLVNSTDARVRFDLRGVAEGAYDVVAANGAAIAVAPGAFAVGPLRPLAVAIDVHHADVLRRTATGQFQVVLTNTSNQDAGVVGARLLFPATSELRGLDCDPGLLRRSDLYPDQFAKLAGDAYVIHGGSGDSLTAIDLLGADLSPGESRSVTLGVSGFRTSPYSVRVLAEGMTLEDYLDRASHDLVAARQSILSGGTAAGWPLSLVQLAATPVAFRDSSLLGNTVASGLLAETDVMGYLVTHMTLALPGAPDPGPRGPAELLDALASGLPCDIPSVVPECQPDQAQLTTAMPPCLSVLAGSLPQVLHFGGGHVIELPGSSVRGFSSTASADARVVVPCDPNVMSGPAGFGTDHWVTPATSMRYRVDFENLPGVASAPAQVVKVTVPIDPALDITSFRLGDLGFGPTSLVAMGSQRTSYSGQGVYSDLGLAVRITAGINPVTRLASWTFTTIDPATGQQPVNPYVGFLPVNDAFGSGTGFVTYTAAPAAGLASGATASAQATIQFDVNAPLATTTATNRIDTRPPVSATQTTVTVLDPTHVRLHWTSADDTTGSGLSGVGLYVRRDQDPFTPLVTGLTGNTLDLPLVSGHAYGFFTLAADNAGNVEPAKGAAEAAVTLGTPQTGIGGPLLPKVTALYANFPNPFRTTTTVRFDLATAEKVTLEIYDVQGRRVLLPLSGRRLEAGAHAVELRGLPRGPGVYFYRLRAGAFEQTRRMVLVR